MELSEDRCSGKFHCEDVGETADDDALADCSPAELSDDEALCGVDIMEGEMLREFWRVPKFKPGEDQGASLAGSIGDCAASQLLMLGSSLVSDGSRSRWLARRTACRS